MIGSCAVCGLEPRTAVWGDDDDDDGDDDKNPLVTVRMIGSCAVGCLMGQWLRASYCSLGW